MQPLRRRLFIVILAIAALAVALVTLHQYRRVERARKADERAGQMERVAEEATRAREQALRLQQQAEARAREKQARIARERQEQADREAAARAEEERRAAQAERDLQEQRRREAERAREERERRLTEQERQAEQERLATERENARLEEERRRSAELEARRKDELAAEEEARAQEAAAQVPKEPDDDTPEVETETTVDAVPKTRGWRVAGDIRPIMDGIREEARDGSSDSQIAPGIRARIGASFGITKNLHLGTRLAGTGFLGDFNPEFVRPGDVRDSSELGGGEFTFDQLYFLWKRVDRFDIAIGRLQTRFVLRGGVYAKSLDRNDSNNWRVTWTDGLQATLRTGGWTSNLVLQRNTRGGTGSIRRDPLDFDDDGARNTYFLGFENRERWGPLVQRAFDISYLPSSLLKDGEPEGRRTDYWGLVGRLMVRWPPEKEGLRLRAGAEIGYAPETPTAEAKGLPGTGDADGLAWDVVISAMDFAPGHSIGVNYGLTGAGWLLSPQFRPNEELIEIRHMWRPERLPLLESRIRRRQELDPLVDSAQRRTQYDFFVRLTWRFTLKE